VSPGVQAAATRGRRPSLQPGGACERMRPVRTGSDGVALQRTFRLAPEPDCDFQHGVLGDCRPL